MTLQSPSDRAVAPAGRLAASAAGEPPRTPGVEDIARDGPNANVAWWRAAAIGAGAIAGAVALLAAVWLFARPLALLFAAIAVAQALAPIVARLERGLPRLVAVVSVYLGVVLALSAIAWLAVPGLVAQAQEVARNAPALLTRGRDLANRWDPIGDGRIVDALGAALGRLSEALLALPFVIFSSLAEILLVLFMSAYWLLAAPALHRFVRSLLPPERADRVDAVLSETGRAIGGYVRGEVTSATIVGAITLAGLAVIDVDYALVLALLAFAGELVPVLGPILSGVPAVAVALLESPTQAAIVVAFYVALQQIESNVLLPQIMRRQADVPPLLALAAILAGAGIGSVLGALVAIPLAAALKVAVVRVVAPAIRGWSGAARAAPATDGSPPAAG